MVTSVAAGSMGSIEKTHTATTEKSAQYEERQKQWKAQCFRPWLLISQRLIHNAVPFLEQKVMSQFLRRKALSKQMLSMVFQGHSGSSQSVSGNRHLKKSIK